MKPTNRTTKPIRTLDDIQRLKQAARSSSSRDYMMIVTLLNTGLRISDAIRLKPLHIRNGRLSIDQVKTGKRYDVQLNPAFYAELSLYLHGMDSQTFIFQSRNGGNISRTQAFRIIKRCGQAIGIDISAHTLRKTFGYQFYMETKDIAQLTKIFGHSRPSITLDYIDITKDEIDESMAAFYL